MGVDHVCVTAQVVLAPLISSKVIHFNILLNMSIQKLSDFFTRAKQSMLSG